MAVPASDDLVGTVDRDARTLDYVGTRRSTAFHHLGASYVKVHFNRLRLLPGDYVTVSDPGGSLAYRYAGGAGRWAMSVDGDTAVLTLHTGTRESTGRRGRLAGLGVGVDRVARGFTAAERAARASGEAAAVESTRAVGGGRAVAGAVGARRASAGPVGAGRAESICGPDDKRDAACYKSTDPVPYARSKAVARLLINGVELCSAFRIGPNNRMLTNHHCLADSASARNTEVWFNYECAVCGAPAVLATTKVRGDRVIATNERLDYTLFSVQGFGSIRRFGYLRPDVRAPRAGEELYIPQHPAGDPTKIAIGGPFERDGNCKVDQPSYRGYGADTDLSYYCDTEGGSSGSPVLARATDKVIGLHHFGGCPNSAVRIDLVYREIGARL
jgi:hypothetical protein